MMIMSQQMKKMLIITGIFFGIIFGIYGIKKIFFMYVMSHYVPPAVTVSSSVATPKTWQSFLSSVGSLTAVNGVDVSAEVPGIVRGIYFDSGQFITQGSVLVLLDTSVEQAQLKDNQAKLKLARLNYVRNQTLMKRNVISQSVLDSSLAELQEGEAGVEQSQAKIKQKTITAPFNGKIGIRQINLGEYVSAGTTMVTLQSLDPLYVRFNLPEQYLANLYLQQPIDISLKLANDKPFTVRGTVTAINSKVDQATRSILVQATIPNRDLQLYPGMFALVKVWLKEQKDTITLPQTAISYSLHGDSVFIIKDDRKSKNDKPLLRAYRQYVEVGERRGAEASILKGLKPGDQVVTSGQLKLQNGTHIEIDNSVEP
jgi:membrane fusion protein (multidrug efflux system)